MFGNGSLFMYANFYFHTNIYSNILYHYSRANVMDGSITKTSLHSPITQTNPASQSLSCITPALGSQYLPRLHGLQSVTLPFPVEFVYDPLGQCTGR